MEGIVSPPRIDNNVNNKQTIIMTQAKARINSLTLVNIFNNMETMLHRGQTLDNIEAAEFWELVEIKSKIYDAIFMSIEDVTLLPDRLEILNQIK